MKKRTEGRANIEREVIEKALKDDVFRQALIANPKETLEKEIGVQFPQNLQIKVLQETRETLYLVLPFAPASGTDLTTQEMAGAAADCSGWSSFAECLFECTQCGNNETSCQPGDSEE